MGLIANEQVSETLGMLCAAGEHEFEVLHTLKNQPLNKQSNKQSNKFGNWKNAQYGLKYLSHLGLNKQSNKQSLGYQRPPCSATPFPTPQQTKILSHDIRRITRVLSQPQLFGKPLKRRGNVLCTEH